MPGATARPDPEVVAVARVRRFSAGEKRVLLAEADRCKAAGTLGAFLRSKRIYSSMLSSWRKQVETADRVALAPKRRGPKPDPSARQIEQFNRDNARLRRKLERAELIIEAQKKLCVALGLPTADDRSEEAMMLAVADLAPHVGLKAACRAFGLHRGFVYRDRARHRTIGPPRAARARPRPPLALSSAEQEVLPGVLDSEHFADVAPPTVYATLLDEGRYHGSIRTMYRLLASRNQGGERRNQRVHPVYAKPELLAVRPREVWSWT